MSVHRPELLECGDRFFLVQQSQRASRLHELSKAEAEAVLVDLPQQPQEGAPLPLKAPAAVPAPVADAASMQQQLQQHPPQEALRLQG